MSDKDVHTIITRLRDRYIMQNEFNIIGNLELSCYLECLEEVEEELED